MKNKQSGTMPLSQASLNRIWARLILAALYRQGVKHFCLAPGSRSTPLTLELDLLAQNKSDVSIHTHFDERGLGFLSLGLAKAQDAAVAVIVTSGTAVANLLPAVVESGLTREKLILLTADRPQALIQCGANQAIVQQNIFSSHVLTACYLPDVCENVSVNWLLALLDEQLARQKKLGGSVHINCAFAEPLYGGLESHEQKAIEQFLQPVGKFLSDNQPYLAFEHATKMDFSALISRFQHMQEKKGVIVVGNIKKKEQKAILSFANKLGWPVLADIQSGIATDFYAYDLWLQSDDCLALLKQCEYVLQFGARLVSKRLGQFLQDFDGIYWLVDENEGRLDPHHLSASRIQCEPSAFVHEFHAFATYHPWADKLKLAAKQSVELVKPLVQSEKLSEIGIAYDFENWINKSSSVFIGNSLVIRLLDMLSNLPCPDVFANRGASGIDGLIATAAGVQSSLQKPMVCILGDISALYDLNSLALLNQCQHPFVLLIINNDGCGIFDMLPVPEESKACFYRMSHHLDFFHAAKMFGFDYHAPKTLHQAKSLCLDAQSKNQVTLIELKVLAGESGQELKALFNQVRDAKFV